MSIHGKEIRQIIFLLFCFVSVSFVCLLLSFVLRRNPSTVRSDSTHDKRRREPFSSHLGLVVSHQGEYPEVPVDENSEVQEDDVEGVESSFVSEPPTPPQLRQPELPLLFHRG